MTVRIAPSALIPATNSLPIHHRFAKAGAKAKLICPFDAFSLHLETPERTDG
jgi:hypothetical protein